MGYWISRGSSENLHSHSCDTDKKQKHSRCHESSLCSASICLSVRAACEKVVGMKQKTGAGRTHESLIRRIWVKKLRKARRDQKNTYINDIEYAFNEVFGIVVFKRRQTAPWRRIRGLNSMYVIYLRLLFQFSAFLCQAQQDTANVMDGWLAPGRGPENEERMLVWSSLTSNTSPHRCMWNITLYLSSNGNCSVLLEWILS